MSLKTFVKIGSVNNLSDARYCAGMSVDLIGFNIDPESSDPVSPDKFKEITEWISGIDFAGEFETDNPITIIETLKNYQAQYLQVSHPQVLHETGILGLPTILKVDLSNFSDIDQFKEYLNYSNSLVSFFLVEGNNNLINDHLLYTLTDEFPLLIGTGISDKNVNDLINQYAIKGISLKGGNEIKPGFKDYDELAYILEAIEKED